MDCNRIREYIYPFLDGELDPKTTALVNEHISACPICSLELEQEKRADCLIRQVIPKEKAPYELKEAILSRIKGFGEKNANPFVRPLLRPILTTAAASVLVVTLISFLLVNINKPFPVFSESVKDHLQFLQGNLPIDFASNKPAQVHSWLQAKLDFKVMVPDLSSQGVNLLGARVCSLQNKKAAYIMYGRDGHKLSVLMFDAEGLRFPKSKKVFLNNKTFYLSREKGYNSALWIDEGIACVFVSDLGQAELLHLASL